jgi:hypothetical protein
MECGIVKEMNKLQSNGMTPTNMLCEGSQTSERILYDAIYVMF